MKILRLKDHSNMYLWTWLASTSYVLATSKITQIEWRKLSQTWLSGIILLYWSRSILRFNMWFCLASLSSSTNTAKERLNLIVWKLIGILKWSRCLLKILYLFYNWRITFWLPSGIEIFMVLKIDMICTVECSTFRHESSIEKNVSRSSEQIMSQGSLFSSLIFQGLNSRRTSTLLG